MAQYASGGIPLKTRDPQSAADQEVNELYAAITGRRAFGTNINVRWIAIGT